MRGSLRVSIYKAACYLHFLNVFYWPIYVLIAFVSLTRSRGLYRVIEWKAAVTAYLLTAYSASYILYVAFTAPASTLPSCPLEEHYCDQPCVPPPLFYLQSLIVAPPDARSSL